MSRTLTVLKKGWKKHGPSHAGTKERERLNPAMYPADAEVSMSDQDLRELSEQRKGAETGGVAEINKKEWCRCRKGKGGTIIPST